MKNKIAAFLAGVYPFSVLPDAELEKAGSLAELYPVLSGEVLNLVQKNQKALYVVQSGTVQILTGNETVDTLIIGDFFGHESFFFPSSLGQSAVAVQDGTLIVISAQVLQEILKHQEAYRYFRHKAEIFRNRVHDLQHWRNISRMDPYLRLTLKDVRVRAPLHIEAGATVSQAAKVMFREKSPTCLVRQDNDFKGIFTESDILKKVVAKDINPENIEVGEIMCSPLITVRSDELLFQAFSRMVRSGIRRLVVLGAEGKPKGIIEERDLLSVKGENPVYLSGEIARAGDFTALGKVFEQVQAMVVRSVGEGIGIFHVGRLVSDMHDQILARVMDLILNETDQPPSEFCLAVMGSEGRREQYLATDQDNALIYAEDDEEIKIFFERFAERFTQALLELGFPPCSHQVMINNPAWNMSLDRWLDTVDEMILKGDMHSILKTSLLLDMRPVAGKEQFARMLKNYLFRRAGSSPYMLKYMANEALRFKPPLGFFSNLIVEKSGANKGKMDIKKGGVFPLTQGIRTLSVDHAIQETSTEERIIRLQDAGAFSAGLSAGIREAYEFFQTLRVRTQAEQVRNEEKPDNYIAPDRLSAMERDKLKDCFKIVNEFQSLLYNKYGLHLMT